MPYMFEQSNVPEMLLDNSTLRIVWMQDSLKILQQRWYVITSVVHVNIHSAYPILIQMTRRLFTLVTKTNAINLTFRNQRLTIKLNCSSIPLGRD